MRYCLPCSKDIDTCNNLKKEVIVRLNSLHLPLWNEEYPSDELIKEDIESGRGRIILNDEDEIIAYASVASTIEEFNEEVFLPRILKLNSVLYKKS